MKKVFTFIAVMALTFVFTAAFAVEGSTSENSESGTSMSGTSASGGTMIKRDIIGKEVRNNEGEKLGKISDVTVDPETDQVAFVIVSSGGILGIGDKLIPVPVNSLTYRDKDNVILNISKEKLEKAPKYTKSDLPAYSDRAKYDETYRYFGVRPQWEQDRK